MRITNDGICSNESGIDSSKRFMLPLPRSHRSLHEPALSTVDENCHFQRRKRRELRNSSLEEAFYYKAVPFTKQ
jgi:hypothetical protein